MSLEYLEQTLLTCIEYHKRKGNSVKVQQLTDKLKSAESASLFCTDVKLNYLYVQT